MSQFLQLSVYFLTHGAAVTRCCGGLRAPIASFRVYFRLSVVRPRACRVSNTFIVCVQRRRFNFGWLIWPWWIERHVTVTIRGVFAYQRITHLSTNRASRATNTAALKLKCHCYTGVQMRGRQSWGFGGRPHWTSCINVPVL